MADLKSRQLSPESVARAHRQRLAQEDGARAMADVEKSAIAVRKNMARLRALREIKEAQEKSEQKIIPAKKKSNTRKLANSK